MTDISNKIRLLFHPYIIFFFPKSLLRCTFVKHLLFWNPTAHGKEAAYHVMFLQKGKSNLYALLKWLS